MRPPYRPPYRAARLALIDVLESRRLMAGTPTFTVAFDDPDRIYEDYYTDVRGTLLAAASDWAKHIDSGARIELLVDFDPTLRSPTLATAGFDRRVFFRSGPGYDVELGNVASELRTGKDPNGSEYDAFISLRPGALDEFYYDASANRTGTVPSNLIDARTVLLHELGHTLGFFGDGDGPGDSPAGDRFVYDQYVRLDEIGDLYFHGPNAMAEYGAPVPLSFEDSSHVGNDGGPGQDIADDLMAPTIADGARRFISDLDLAMLADAGVPMKVSALPQVNVSDVTVTRTGAAGQTVDFVLTLSKAPAVTVSVPVVTATGTAAAGRDYVAISRVVRFQPGETSKVVSVKLLAGSPFDPTKQFYLNLGLPSGAALLRGEAVATIRNGVIAADARHTATLRAGGNVITVNVRGPGVAVLNKDGQGRLDTITLTGSNAGTSLIIRGRRPATLRGITARGGVGTVDAAGIDFAGTMKLVGASSVTFRNILEGSSITLGAAPRALSLTAKNMTGSLLRAQGAVSSIVLTGRLSTTTIRAHGSVDSVSVGSAVSSNVLVGTEGFPLTREELANKRAVLRSFTVRQNGLFSDTRVAAASVTQASLGVVDADNADAAFGLAADTIGTVTASTPLEPSFKRTNLRAPQEVAEDDFVVRVL